jgi:SAM-dependent methyltransferase
MREVDSKAFYSTYHANNEVFEIDHILTDMVIDLKPESVFDYGTGTGKNLKLIQEKMKYRVEVCGLDLSFLNIIHARAIHYLPFLVIGDEAFLKYLNQFDVSITCSVLCHIPDIRDIVLQLQRISKHIVITETNDEINEHYYPHNYEAHGFVDQGINWYSAGNNANYKFYKWSK